jgi:hypothetical protein
MANRAEMRGASNTDHALYLEQWKKNSVEGTNHGGSEEKQGGL